MLLKQQWLAKGCCTADHWHQAGRLLQRLGRQAQARRAYQRVLELEPQRPRTFSNLVLLELDALQADAANHWLQRGLALPDLNDADAELLHAAGCDLRLFQRRPSEALDLCNRQLQRQPSVTALANRALCLQQLGRKPEAIHSQEQALRLHLQLQAPELASQPFEQLVGTPCRDLEASIQLQRQLLNLGIYRLQADGFDQAAQTLLLAGLSNERAAFLDHRRQATLWKGELCQRLILWDDQGFGDALQSVGWVSAAAQRCQHLELQVRPALIPLLEQRLHREQNVTISPLNGAQPPWGAADSRQLALFYLPFVLKRWTPASPPRLGYLKRLRTDHSKRPRIGLLWNAGRHRTPRAERNARIRDVPFDQLWSDLGDLLNADNLDLVSLQLDQDNRDAVDQCTGGAMAWPLASPCWLQTARVMDNLDAVICVDTSIAHLAGAMGVPTLLMLGDPCDWRWGADGDATFLYSAMRLVRCPSPGAWKPMLEAARSHLIALLRQRGTA
ncbi:tetratricopeptide repeat family protein [Synechococcus sp. PROS-7-1]|uniref:tetratricopeptide repeat protein n=1 Tax=Synechococcus sp. PROS-7-1 TaxID=1442556 RepID=UPI001644CC7F|nr:glycosyltransferase family 9 protein [Synechococcus sp. PROS-7-1]QNI84003.1 tetratricopeptide repeat family protein [Synechococcus sp. PROS-7-1]